METGNQALSWLLNHPKQLGRIGKLILRLNCYKFNVQHVRGTQNVVTDTLLRIFQPNNDKNENNETHKKSNTNTLITNFPLAFTDLAQYQNTDPVLGEIIKELKCGTMSEKYILKFRFTMYKTSHL